MSAKLARSSALTTGSSPRRVCSTTRPRPSRREPTSRPALPTAVIAARRADSRGARRYWSKSTKITTPHRRTLCQIASVPTTTRASGELSSLAAVTSLTTWDSWAATSRARVVTPTRTRLRFVAPQCRQKLARISWRREQASISPTSSSPCSHVAQRASSPHLRHAKSRPEPSRCRTTHTATASSPASAWCAASSATRERAPSRGSLWRRSAISTRGHPPARSSSIWYAVRFKSAGEGMIDVHHSGASSRRHRSRSIVTASHVGAASERYASSMMKAPETLDSGARAAPRAPTTTGHPARMRSHSPSPDATWHPRCSSRPRRRWDHDSVGTSTRNDPSLERLSW